MKSYNPQAIEKNGRKYGERMKLLKRKTIQTRKSFMVLWNFHILQG